LPARDSLRGAGNVASTGSQVRFDTQPRRQDRAVRSVAAVCGAQFAAIAFSQAAEPVPP
jgi:hypothetical protein